MGSRKFRVQTLLLSGFSALGGTRILRVPVLRGLFVHEVTDTSAILDPDEAYCDLVFARRTAS